MIQSARQLYNYVFDQVKVYDAAERRSICFILLEKVAHLHKTHVLTDKPLRNVENILPEIETFVQRLNQHEPIQYILGESDFYGRKFKVNPHVLIPRPETEELVAEIIQQYKFVKNLNILDIGTGSGCIAITLAKELPNARVTAIDISEEALKIADFNTDLHHAPVMLLHRDVLEDDFKNHDFNLIVSNPPYVTDSEKQLMRENVLQFEPHQALFVHDHDPLLFYRTILQKFSDSVNKPVQFYFEINEKYPMEMFQLLKEYGCRNINIQRDLNQKPRMVSGLL